MTKRIISFLLTILILFSSVACKKQETTTSTTTEATAKVIEKPKSITVMWNDTMPTKDGKSETFAKELSKELGIEVKLITVDYDPYSSSYLDELETALNSQEAPDVFILPSYEYAYYARQGVLWDMKEAWDNSELKASGRLKDWAIDRLSTLEIEGKDKKNGMYGFSIERDDANVTIVRTAWLEECNLKVPTNYEEFINMCKVFKEKYQRTPMCTYPPFASLGGYLGYGPHTPEVFQNAKLGFYKNEEGKWVDGFSEPRTKDAIYRMKKEYDEYRIYINSSSGCTTYHYDEFAEGKFGIVTTGVSRLSYIEEKFKEKNVEDDRITILPPIEEVGCYYENQTPVVVINSKAANPEGIFKYFIEPIYDGGKVQSLWTYGVQGVHWDYVDGKAQGYNVIKPEKALGELADEYNVSTMSETMKKYYEVLNKYGKTEPVMYEDDNLGWMMSRIFEARNKCCTNIIESNYDEGEYYSTIEYTKADVEECLRILNE